MEKIEYIITKNRIEIGHAREALNNLYTGKTFFVDKRTIDQIICLLGEMELILIGEVDKFIDKE